jgi:hypothetical protein
MGGGGEKDCIQNIDEKTFTGIVNLEGRGEGRITLRLILDKMNVMMEVNATGSRFGPVERIWYYWYRTSEFCFHNVSYVQVYEKTLFRPS